MVKRTVTMVAVALAALIAGVGFFWPFGKDGDLKFSGIVEIQEVRLGSKVGGRVAEMLVAEGDVVTRGAKLVIFDVPELENMREQLKARVDAAAAELKRAVDGAREEEKRALQAAADAAKARYDKMLTGWREEEKQWSQSELDSAEAEFKQTTEDMVRIADLYRSRSVARAEYDAVISSRDRAQGRVSAARARRDMHKLGNRKEDKDEAKAEWQRAQANADLLHNGTRPEDIALARAKLDEMKAKLQETEINLKEAVVRVPETSQFDKAVVEVVPVRPGDIVAAGQPVVRILCVNDLWVKIFVPETKLGQVTLQQEADVTIDSHPGKVFKGYVKQRASISEFTPRNVQSADERRHQVFAVKIRVDDPQGVLSAGMAAEVRLRAER